jgi:hypothetical protein
MRTFLIIIGCLLSFAASAAQIDGSTGNIGEVIFSDVPLARAVSLTTKTTANVTSVSLTAGDWMCSANVDFTTGSKTVVTVINGWITTESATVPSALETDGFVKIYTPSTPGIIPGLAVGVVRFSLASTTTVYLETSSAFTKSTNAAYGLLLCRRAR